jgi:hypothetical protein
MPLIEAKRGVMVFKAIRAQGNNRLSGLEPEGLQKEDRPYDMTYHWVAY